MRDAGYYYTVLELQAGASLEEIKQAYRELAVVWHPDRFANAPNLRRKAEQKMREINAAYEFLISYRPAAETPASRQEEPRQESSGAPDLSERTTRRPSASSGILFEEATRVLHGQPANLTGIALSPDGQIAWAGGNGLRAWNTATGEEIREWRIEKGEITGLCVSPCGRYLLYGFTHAILGAVARYEVRACETRTPRILYRHSGLPCQVTTADFSADGEQTVTGDAAGGMRLYETATQRLLRHFPATLSPCSVHKVAFCDNGRRVVSLRAGHVMEEILVWEARSGKIDKELTPHIRDCRRYGQIQDIAPSPDGKTLLVANNDPLRRAWSLHLWDMQTGNEIQTLLGHDDRIRKVAYSPNGRWCLSCSDDRTLRLWDAGSGRELCRFSGHTRSVADIALSQRDRYVLSGGADGKARLWTIPHELQKEIGA